MFHLARKTSISSIRSPSLFTSSLPRVRRCLLLNNYGSSDVGTMANNNNGGTSGKSRSCCRCISSSHYNHKMTPFFIQQQKPYFYSTTTTTLTQQQQDISNSKENISTPGNSSASTITKRLEIVTDKVRAKMHWNLSDFISVVSAGALLTGIVLGPYVVEKMKKSQNSYEELVVDDEYTNLLHVFQEYRNEIKNNADNNNNNNNNNNNPMISLVLDICKQVVNNPEIQESLQNMLTRVLKSPPVKEALEELSKETSTKLLKDEEFLQNVLQLLKSVITDKGFQNSANVVLVHILQDSTFQKELVQMIVRTSQNDLIIQATKVLLTESAHKTLKDPEILDHSMEFAADVVGDDFVQRTSGEALWNTISYSVQPAFFSMMYFAGAVLVGFAFVALSKAQFYSNVAALATLDSTKLNKNTWLWSWCYWTSWELLGQQFRSTITRVLSTLVIQPCHVIVASGKFLTRASFRIIGDKYNNNNNNNMWNTIKNRIMDGTIFYLHMTKHAFFRITSTAASTVMVQLSNSTAVVGGFVKTVFFSFGSYCYKGMKFMACELPHNLYQLYLLWKHITTKS